MTLEEFCPSHRRSQASSGQPPRWRVHTTRAPLSHAIRMALTVRASRREVAPERAVRCHDLLRFVLHAPRARRGRSLDGVDGGDELEEVPHTQPVEVTLVPRVVQVNGSVRRVDPDERVCVSRNRMELTRAQACRSGEAARRRAHRRPALCVRIRESHERRVALEVRARGGGGAMREARGRSTADREEHSVPRVGDAAGDRGERVSGRTAL